MKSRLHLLLFGAMAMFAGAFVSCSDDDLGPTIFDTTYHPLDRTQYTFPLDTFIEKEFREPYNLRFLYKMEDIGSNMNYNLVPCSYENSMKFAVLSKYLWYDIYKKIGGVEFLKKYSPRIIHLIGSPAYNPSSGTELLGVAEGGLKITLYKGNELDVTSIDSLNEYFFRTMHHEFNHILHQNVVIPVEFRDLSNGSYNALNWQDTNDSIALSNGFMLQYASSGYREDWVEIVANYVTRDRATWDGFINTAGFGWENDSIEPARYNAMVNTPGVNMDSVGYRTFKDLAASGGGIAEYGIIRKQIQRDMNDKPVLDEDGNMIYLDTDGIDGRALLLRKFEIVKEWLQINFGIDLEALRKEVQNRQFVTNADGSYVLDEKGKPLNKLMAPSDTDPSKTLMETLLDEVNKYKELQK